MKLLRFGKVGQEKPGIEVDGVRYDTSHLVEDYNEDFFASDGINKLKETFDPAKATIIENDVRLGEPVRRPGKIICIGLNYRNHAKESGLEIPKEPIVFFKATSSIRFPLCLPKGMISIKIGLEHISTIISCSCEANRWS